ncbi:hypothetical protein L3X38_020672 [Prunus dulcis]|uniref:Uncharacterized protein n=1 Tax=Prunus dulcis TaxID=3755 RepID=A0AAD4WE79_PRUDU|nr:hypothetical protein L3X38_020672 [Prunus dulcis]
MRKPVKRRGLGFWVLREARQCDWTPHSSGDIVCQVEESKPALLYSGKLWTSSTTLVLFSYKIGHFMDLGPLPSALLLGNDS